MRIRAQRKNTQENYSHKRLNNKASKRTRNAARLRFQARRTCHDGLTMSLLKRRAPVPDGPGTIGPARLLHDPRNLNAVRSGDVVIVELDGIDSERAQAFLDRGIAAVVNVTRSVSDAYPSRGAGLLVAAGVDLVDEIGTGIWNAVRNGEIIRVDGGVVHLADDSEWTGLMMTRERIAERQEAAASGMSNRLDAVVANATDMLRRERAMFVEGEKIPRLHTDLAKRPVVVVVDGPETSTELDTIRKFIVDHAPVLVGVGAGADLLLNRGYGIDVLIGTGEDLSADAIAKTEEIVLVSPSGALDRPERFEKHGRQPFVFTASGDSPDLALLLVDEHDPSLIVLVGATTGLDQLVERDPVSVAGAFLTRLRASHRLVDASAVQYFTRQRIGLLVPALLLLFGIFAVFVSLAVTPVGREWLDPVISVIATVIPPVGRLFP